MFWLVKAFPLVEGNRKRSFFHFSNSTVSDKGGFSKNSPCFMGCKPLSNHSQWKEMLAKHSFLAFFKVTNDEESKLFFFKMLQRTVWACCYDYNKADNSMDNNPWTACQFAPFQSGINMLAMFNFAFKIHLSKKKQLFFAHGSIQLLFINIRHGGRDK